MCQSKPTNTTAATWCVCVLHVKIHHMRSEMVLSQSTHNCFAVWTDCLSGIVLTATYWTHTHLKCLCLCVWESKCLVYEQKKSWFLGVFLLKAPLQRFLILFSQEMGGGKGAFTVGEQVHSSWLKGGRSALYEAGFHHLCGDLSLINPTKGQSTCATNSENSCKK